MTHEPYQYLWDGVAHAVIENHMEAGVPWVRLVCAPNNKFTTVTKAAREHVVQGHPVTCLSCIAIQTRRA